MQYYIEDTFINNVTHESCVDISSVIILSKLSLPARDKDILLRTRQSMQNKIKIKLTNISKQRKYFNSSGISFF